LSLAFSRNGTRRVLSFSFDTITPDRKSNLSRAASRSVQRSDNFDLAVSIIINSEVSRAQLGTRRSARSAYLLQARVEVQRFELSLHWYINYTHVGNQCLTRGREGGRGRWEGGGGGGFTKLCRGLRCTRGYRARYIQMRAVHARSDIYIYVCMYVCIYIYIYIYISSAYNITLSNSRLRDNSRSR